MITTQPYHSTCSAAQLENNVMKSESRIREPSYQNLSKILILQGHSNSNSATSKVKGNRDRDIEIVNTQGWDGL